MPVDPDRRRTHQLALLSPVHGLYRIGKTVPSPSLDLHERHQSISLRNQIDVSMAAPEPPLQHAPPTPTEPSLGHSLSHLAEFLPCRGHGANVQGPASDASPNEPAWCHLIASTRVPANA